MANEWDVFISHASEDKAEIARPLAAALGKRGIKVWLDENELKLGDSLRNKIDYGLSNSTYGVVILSVNFFSKKWPADELGALLSKESCNSNVILPVWHGVTKKDVAKYSPILSDRLAADSKDGIDSLAFKIIEALAQTESHIKSGLIEDESAGSDYLNDMLTYYLTKEPEALQIHSKLKQLFCKDSNNPAISIIRNYYVITESFHKLDSIFSIIRYASNLSCVAITGEQGSGKTAALNTWLATKNDKIESENIFWIRCNVYKIYKLCLDYLYINSDNNEVVDYVSWNRIMSIKDYIDIQLVYVVSKYFKSLSNNVIGKLISILISNKITFRMPVSRSTDIATENRDLYEYIVEQNDIIQNYEKAHSSFEEANYSIDSVMKISLDSSQLNKRKWIACAQALKNVMRENNFWMLNIIDDADSISYVSKTSQNDSVNELAMTLRKVMFNNICNYIVDKPCKKHINLLPLKDDTLSEILSYRTNKYEDSSQLLIIKNMTADFKDILSKRIEYARTEFLDIDSVYGNCVKKITESVSDISNETYNNNVRKFLYDQACSIEKEFYITSKNNKK